MLVLKNTIKENRNERNIKQQQMADELGITRETLGKLERGQLQNPYFMLVYEVATYFGKRVEDVFVFEDHDE